MTNEEMDLFLRKFGTRGESILSILGGLRQFHDALMTPIGKELLSDLNKFLSEKAVLIEEEKADERDWGEFRAYLRIGRLYAVKVNNLYKTEKQLTETIGEIKDEIGIKQR